ncbi:flagellar basal body rod protein FlgB [Posidoniimonas polymericola]|uniref:Flagellar basal body rod protein FlgB n=1 Tax=Posidoniimonas polymericola TaxID=2528002 RepID=A0A5C5YQS0_9BACT|nr:flagellar basal body rod protein FlgB [Posidoniimonas polymericola]TWT77213.1 flagellar basal body rod protein FlgB [Posidoniimonas polymericola]
MAPDIFRSSTLPVLEQVVNFSQARHGVLAGNIANLDTPGYKTRDLSPELFQENLKQAIEDSRRPASAGQAGAASGGGGKDRFDSIAKVKDSLKSILRHDGVDVSLEHQIAEISKNHAQHNLAVNLMSTQFRQLRSAISERQV